jgi:hypothetical protein
VVWWRSRPLSVLIWAQSKEVIKVFVNTFVRPFGSKYCGYAWLFWWVVISILLYSGGLLLKVDSGGNYLLILGRITSVFAIRAGMLMLKPLFLRLHPEAAVRMYEGGSNLYFAQFLVILFATAIALCVKLMPIANELVIIAFLSMVIGATQAVWVSLKRGGK